MKSISRFLVTVQAVSLPRPLRVATAASSKGAARALVAKAEGCPLRCCVSVSRLAVLHRCAGYDKPRSGLGRRANLI